MTTLKNITPGDRSWTFADGSTRSVVILDTVAIGRGVYKPGWRWSEHVGAYTGKESAHHIGYVVSGRFGFRDASGTEGEIGPGEACEIGPGHDAWVIGDEPCVALDVECAKIDTA